MSRNVIQQSVVDEFVMFAGGLDADTLQSKLPEFNQAHQTRYTVKAMLRAVIKFIGPLELPAEMQVEPEAAVEMQATTEVVVENAVEMQAATEVVVENAAVPEAASFDFGGIDLGVIRKNFLAINSISEYLRKAQRKWDEADRLVAAIQQAEEKLPSFDRVISRKAGEIKARQEEITGLFMRMFEAFYASCSAGAELRTLVENAETLEAPQRELLRQTVEYITGKFREDPAARKIEADIAALRADTASLCADRDAIKEEIVRARRAIPMLRNDANHIRRNAGAAPLQTA